MGLVSVQTGAMRADRFQEKCPTFKVCFWCVYRGRGIVKRYIEADSGFAESIVCYEEQNKQHKQNRIKGENKKCHRLE